MQARVVAHIPVRFLVLVMIGLLCSFPVMAQNGKVHPKPPAAATDDGTSAPDAQSGSEASATPNSEVKVTPPAKQSGSVPAKVTGAASAKPSGSGAVKNTAPAAAEPIVPIVPPPGPPAQENAAAAVQPRTNAPIAAEQTVPAAAEASLSVPSSGWADLIKTIGSVGLIICLILAGYILFRKYAPQYIAKRPNERNLRIIETLPLGDKRSIVMVQAGSQQFLLASTPGQISLLTTIPATNSTYSSRAAISNESDTVGALSGSFKNLYEMEKKTPAARPAAVKALSPDIRGKMLELRKALEG
jgi:flagellar biosynthetic protein FliO